MFEYLYVDTPRLDRYYDQISSPVQYDKVPVWKVAFGLAGPSVEATQQRSGRAPSLHEKIQKFIDYVQDHDLAGCERTSLFSHRKPNADRPFIVESITARRAHLKRGETVLNI
jgi:hypothetical protein